MLLSAGERISMALLSMAIRELGGDAISFTGSQSGIITNDRHVDARIVEVRPFRVQDELARGRVVVIAGLPGRLVPPRGDHARPRRQRHDRRRDGRGARRRVVRDLLGRGRRVHRRPARRPGGQARRRAHLRGNAGAGGSGREGAERAGRGVREGEGDRHLRARDRVRAARERSRRPTARSCAGTRRECLARLPAWRASATSWCSRRPATPTRLVALLDECGVSGKQLHVAAFGGGADGTTLVISRENLHNEDRLRRDLAAAVRRRRADRRRPWRREHRRRRHQRHVRERAARLELPARQSHRVVRPGDVVVPRHVARPTRQIWTTRCGSCMPRSSSGRSKVAAG